MGMDFGDSLEASTGSNINDPTPRHSITASSHGTPLMAMPLICPAMEMICLVARANIVLENIVSSVLLIHKKNHALVK